VGELVEQVSTAASGMDGLGGADDGGRRRDDAQASAWRPASEQASANVQTVASAAEELYGVDCRDQPFR
jgi:hypothetical protein